MPKIPSALRLTPRTPTDPLRRTTEKAILDATDDQVKNLHPHALKVVEAHVLYHLEADAKGFPFMRETRMWELVFRRAWAMIEHRARRMRHPEDSLGDEGARAMQAALVADYHVWYWSPDEVKNDPRWPTRAALLASWQIEEMDLVSACQRTRHHQWEHLYLMQQSPKVMKAKVLRRVMKDIDDYEHLAPTERNPGLYRAADALLSEKKTEVHIGNKNTVNMLNVNSDEFNERVKRLTEVAHELKAKEVPYHEVETDRLPAPPAEVPHRENPGEPADGPPGDGADRRAS